MQNSKDEQRTAQLKKVVRRVWERVPHYRAKMEDMGLSPEDIRSLEDLSRLPFTTKNDLRDTYPYGLLACDKEEVVRIHASSGTTGKPTVVAYTRQDIRTWSSLMAHRLSVAGLSSKDVFQVALGYGLFTGALGFHWGAEELGALVIPSGGGFSERQALLMEDLGTTAFTSTPSYALHLAEVLQSEKRKNLQLRLGIFGAEAWTEEMRTHLEESLGIQALDSYGLSEIIGPGVAMECPRREGLHFDEDHFLVEIIDPETGAVLPPGETGEIVITTLTKEALPMIRYRTRDLSRLYPEPCPCGCGEKRIARILGRSDDMLIIRGVNVFPSQVEVALGRVPGLSLHYFLEVSEKGGMKELTVCCESKAPLSEEAAGNLIRKTSGELKALLGVRIGVRLFEPGAIERSGGKAVRIKKVA
ncbi:MAG TPA: phenylacetate--CoA ligase [Synergistaceae bacterium]|nr:phenylacetate--CoA ligase [Synergistaceae bacterium]